MSDPRVEIVNDVSGIVEGSDEHLEYDLFDDNNSNAGQNTPAREETTTEVPTRSERGSTPPTDNKAPVNPQQQNPHTSNVDQLKERQLATTVVPALQNENRQLRQQFEQATQQINSYKELQTSMQNYGINPQEAQIGFQLASSWKTDPGGTIQKLLTYAASKGIKVEGAPQQQVTRDMLSSLIEEKLAPVLQRTRQEEQQQQHQLDAQRQATEFLTEYPDAVTHQDAIATVMRQHNLTPQRAYVELMKYANAQGLDWSQPLAPQLRARTANPNTNSAPARNAYSPGVREVDSLPTREVNLPGDDTSYRNIVNSVLSEFGVSR